MYVYNVDEVGMPKSECVWNRGGDVQFRQVNHGRYGPHDHDLRREEVKPPGSRTLVATCPLRVDERYLCPAYAYVSRYLRLRLEVVRDGLGACPAEVDE